MAVVTRLCRSATVVDAAMAAARSDPRVFGDLAEMGLGRGLLTGRALRGVAYGLVSRTGW